MSFCCFPNVNECINQPAEWSSSLNSETENYRGTTRAIAKCSLKLERLHFLPSSYSLYQICLLSFFEIIVDMSNWQWSNIREWGVLPDILYCMLPGHNWGGMDGTQTQGRHDALSWFTEFQLDCVIRNGIVPEWFHGIISRK